MLPVCACCEAAAEVGVQLVGVLLLVQPIGRYMLYVEFSAYNQLACEMVIHKKGNRFPQCSVSMWCHLSTWGRHKILARAAFAILPG